MYLHLTACRHHGPLSSSFSTCRHWVGVFVEPQNHSLNGAGRHHCPRKFDFTNQTTPNYSQKWQTTMQAIARRASIVPSIFIMVHFLNTIAVQQLHTTITIKLDPMSQTSGEVRLLGQCEWGLICYLVDRPVFNKHGINARISVGMRLKCSQYVEVNLHFSFRMKTGEDNDDNLMMTKMTMKLI